MTGIPGGDADRNWVANDARYGSSTDETLWQVDSTDGTDWSSPAQLPATMVLGP